MACVDCGDIDQNPNPLDCNTRFLQCNNPCGVSAKNTPQCESLPSQIENFTTQFFGEVFKTEVDGKVMWSLPCQLDTGLPANPRAAGEGLACYFLRLFRDGIGGLTGPRGPQGNAGADGHNAYSVTAQTITVPDLNNPVIQFSIVPNPSILPGLSVFIQGAGWFAVNDVPADGIVVATLVSPMVSAGTSIPAGALVVPGAIGATGLTGPQGPAGPVGPAGTNFTSTFGTWSAIEPSGAFKPGLAVWPMPINAVLGVVDFTSSLFAVTLPVAGTYAIRATVPITTVGGISAGDEITTQLFNLTLSQPVWDSTQYLNGLSAGSVFVNPHLHSLVQTTGPSQVIAVRACISSAVSYALVDFQIATISWFRIA